VTRAFDEIKHVVVLMLENRSFDHLFGFQGQDFSPQPFEGLTGTEAVPEDPGQSASPAVPVVRVDTPAIRWTEVDPGHEFRDVRLQLYGSEEPPPAAPPVNQGFVASYAKQKRSNGQPVGLPDAHRIMGCAGPTQVRVLAELARSFVICDHWFSSVPGPTWPNRFFVHAATSGGHVDSPTAADIILSQIFLSPYRMRTIYESLMQAAPPRKWKIYFQDDSQAFALRGLHEYVGDPDHFARFDDPNHPEQSFHADVRAGRLADYVFIEPQYFPGLTPANDQHPPHDLREGERLVATVYDELRSQPEIWSRCVLVVLWDEHGGFYDHVTPPAAVPPLPPDGLPDPTFGFRFDRLGLRVPALIVSPWVPRGKVDSTVYDHASLLATVKKLFALPSFLTLRDAYANTFDHNFMEAPRDDAPNNLSGLLDGASGAPADRPPLSSYQQSLRALAEAVTAVQARDRAAASFQGP